MKPTWHFFPLWTQNQSWIIKYPTVEQRQYQDKFRHVWSIGVLSFVFWEIQMWTQLIIKYFNKKCPNGVDFLDVIFNFSKLSCGLPPTYCYTGELWLLWFIWHHDPRATHCLSSAMIFFFKQYSFCNSFRHCLLHIHVFNIMESCE